MQNKWIKLLGQLLLATFLMNCGGGANPLLCAESEILVDGLCSPVIIVDPPVTNNDLDADGIVDTDDNCPLVFNPSQSRTEDIDSIADACDNCPTVPNDDQNDFDFDNLGDQCDDNIDGDLFLNDVDNCPNVPNDSQADADGNGVGDICDGTLVVIDIDFDTILDEIDNCVNVANLDQLDFDTDLAGDACDTDDDNDGIIDTLDDCPLNASERCAVLPPAEVDTDGDTIFDDVDNCLTVKNKLQTDTDGDGIGDLCDEAVLDTDGDGDVDVVDNCVNDSNPLQKDLDSDGVGDVCDLDRDGDGLCDASEAPALHVDECTDIDPDGLKANNWYYVNTTATTTYPAGYATHEYEYFIGTGLTRIGGNPNVAGVLDASKSSGSYKACVDSTPSLHSVLTNGACIQTDTMVVAPFVP